MNQGDWVTLKRCAMLNHFHDERTKKKPRCLRGE
jgi:hypothetical protein